MKHRSFTPVMLVAKNLPAKARGKRDAGLIPGSGRSPVGGNGNPLQYSCLENPMDRRAWRATVYGVTKSCPRLKQLSKHVHTLYVDCNEIHGKRMELPLDKYYKVCIFLRSTVTRLFYGILTFCDS